jgi:hypothetical protein
MKRGENNSFFSKTFDHRNLSTRRIMHLFMQDDQIGPKIVGIAPADVARLAPPTITKIVINNLVCQLGLHLL